MAHPPHHAIDHFTGYDFRNMHNGADRAVESAGERKVIINTGAPRRGRGPCAWWRGGDMPT